MEACPRCNSQSVWKDGLRQCGVESKQRYLCRECGYRFSLGSIIYNRTRLVHRQVCDSDRRTKNLISVETKQNTENVTNKKQILHDYAWSLKKQGKAQQTIDGRTSILSTLINRRVNIDDPESVKEYLASSDNSTGRKRNIVHAISSYYEQIGITWKAPQYHRVSKIPWIPQEKQIDQLIAALPGKYKPYLQILKETGMRPGEAWQLKWQDIDLTTKQVRITPEKGSHPRVLPISNELIAMLNHLPRNTEYVFQKGKYKHFSEGFRRHRKKMSIGLGSPNLDRIQLKTFRHYKGTMEYHKTKDILHVMRTPVSYTHLTLPTILLV